MRPVTCGLFHLLTLGVNKVVMLKFRRFLRACMAADCRQPDVVDGSLCGGIYTQRNITVNTPATLIAT
jgi:hypothetical protein